MMTRPGFSASTIALSSFATASGSTTASVFTRIPRSAPIASAVRMVSDACAGPIDTAMISVALPASFKRIASSTAISSKGFIDILMLASSTPEPSGLTRILTLKSTTRFTGTRIFMNSPSRAGTGTSGRKLKAAPSGCQRLCCGAVRLPVLARRPQDIGGAFIIGISSCHEQVIGQPVDVFQRRFRYTLARFVLELNHDALGAAAYCACKVQIGGGRAAARQNERL